MRNEITLDDLLEALPDNRQANLIAKQFREWDIGIERIIRAVESGEAIKFRNVGPESWKMLVSALSDLGVDFEFPYESWFRPKRFVVPLQELGLYDGPARLRAGPRKPDTQHRGRYAVTPGEATTPVIEDADGNAQITSEHSISDVLRYLIECSSYEEVRITLDMMEPTS